MASFNKGVHLEMNGKRGKSTFSEGEKETAPTPEPSTLVLNTVKQSPAAPKAGEIMKVTFLLQNLGKTDVTNVKVSMVD